MKAVIADDEPNLAQHLRDKLASMWPELEVAAVVHSGPQALAAIEQHRPDLAFLDIRMPGATGLEVARQLRARNGMTRIVFVTAFDQYAVEAFERDAVDYLLKPVTDERLSQTIEKLRRGSDTPRPDLDSLLTLLAQRLERPAVERLRWVRASKRVAGTEIVEQIPVETVLYFQADDKYTCVVTREGEALIRVALSDLSAQLEPDTFVQIHRSVIVNMNAVSGTRRDLAGKLYARIRDHARELPVSRQYAALFRQM